MLITKICRPSAADSYTETGELVYLIDKIKILKHLAAGGSECASVCTRRDFLAPQDDRHVDC